MNIVLIVGDDVVNFSGEAGLIDALRMYLKSTQSGAHLALHIDDRRIDEAELLNLPSLIPAGDDRDTAVFLVDLIVMSTADPVGII